MLVLLQEEYIEICCKKCAHFTCSNKRDLDVAHRWLFLVLILDAIYINIQNVTLKARYRETHTSDLCYYVTSIYI